MHPPAVESATTAGGAERRTAPRARVSWRAQLWAPGLDVVEGRIFDISVGGAGVLCGRMYNVGMELELAIGLQDEASPGRLEVLRCRARVAVGSFAGGHCRLGLQFNALPEGMRSRIDRALQRASTSVV